MRIRKTLLVVLMTGLLTACLGGLVARAGTEVLLAILKPMVGLDPNASSLFEQPVIKNRMQGFLGDKYDPVMKLIVTADRLQQEGPLFYVVSRYTPVPDIAEKAGFVWNADTNQMAVMLVTGGSPTIIAEQVLLKKTGQMAAQAVPQWPTELKAVLDQDALVKKAVDAATGNVQSAATITAEQQLEAEIRAQEEESRLPASP